MNEQTEILGYTLEKNWDADRERFNYILHGPRGACYGLVRTVNNPVHMFAINLQRWGKVVNVRGYNWFTDERGFLEPIN